MPQTPRRHPPKASVVLSFFNEETVLPELIRRLRAVFDTEMIEGHVAGYELIFINDNSTDRSLEILRSEFEKKKDLVIVNMSNNFGVSECVMAGMSLAKGDVVIYMDADLQDPPELIRTLLQKWREDPEVDVAYTTRLSRAGEHPLKMSITKWGYRAINAMTKINLPVDSGDFKLLSRRVVVELLRHKEKKPFIRGLISWIGFKQVQVFYHREQRFDGRENTKFPAFSARVINNALDSALISFTDVPLKACLVLGFLVSGIALAYILVVLIQKTMGWHVPGWPALMAAILFLGGVQLLMLGILGLYINNIFLESKERPMYIIKNIVAADDRNRP